MRALFRRLVKAMLQIWTLIMNGRKRKKYMHAASLFVLYDVLVYDLIID